VHSSTCHASRIFLRAPADAFHVPSALLQPSRRTHFEQEGILSDTEHGSATEPASDTLLSFPSHFQAEDAWARMAR
jgi:hypothetical protein